VGAGAHGCGGKAAVAPRLDDPPGDFVRVPGGTLPDIGRGALDVTSFAIGKYEVTWGQWRVVRDWATGHHYDLAGVGEGCADEHPVHDVNWYEAVKWCNALSEMQGRKPVYQVAGIAYRHGQEDDVTVSTDAAGFRLPTSAEWEYAARGGQQSRGYVFSGGDDLSVVGWFWSNSGVAACDLYLTHGTRMAGGKAGNELGLHDMSGNVWEWCFDWVPVPVGTHRILRGGSWSNAAVECAVAGEYVYAPVGRSNYLGLRLAAAEAP
jgi:formylglycine-generating enzyme required for sulfatase activity